MEVLVAVALIATVTSVSAPLVLNARDHADGRQAALILAGHLRAARQQAVLTGRNSALVFDLANETWSARRCTDEDADGVLRADVAAGIDHCGNDHIPVGGVATVVAFGTSRIASFSALGTASSGSVTFRTTAGWQFVIRVAGTTGRVRVQRMAPGAAQWTDL